MDFLIKIVDDDKYFRLTFEMAGVYDHWRKGRQGPVHSRRYMTTTYSIALDQMYLTHFHSEVLIPLEWKDLS